MVGGVIPPDDYAALYEAGAVAIFGPGTNIAEAAADSAREAQRAFGVCAATRHGSLKADAAIWICLLGRMRRKHMPQS